MKNTVNPPAIMNNLLDSKRYKTMELRPGELVPQLRNDYPDDDPYVRLYQPTYIRSLRFDETYPYVDDSWQGRFWRWVGQYVFRHIVEGWMLRLQMGWKVEGRHWLRQYSRQLVGGAITVANHCHRHDCEAVLFAVRTKLTRTRIPMFAANFNTKDLNFLRMVGGVPLPPAEMGMKAMKQFNEAFDEFHRRGYWFHVFPEACKWDWYKPLRPFQKGAFSMSYKYGMPIVPCVITWRKRTGFYRLFGPKEMPLMTVRILEPLMPDTSAPRRQEVDRLRQAAHQAMCEAAGIVRNSWPETEELDA